MTPDACSDNALSDAVASIGIGDTTRAWMDDVRLVLGACWHAIVTMESDAGLAGSRLYVGDMLSDANANQMGDGPDSEPSP